MNSKDQIIKIRSGLDLHLTGSAEKRTDSVSTMQFAIHPDDFRWFNPKLLVNEADAVEVGTPLFVRKSDERVAVVSPVNGVVKQIVRGEKRALKAIIIEADSNCKKLQFEMPSSANDVRQLLLQYGLWPCLRQRPFSEIPSPDTMPKALFVSCFDSSPLAPDYPYLLENRKEEWLEGIRILKILLGDIPIHLSLKADQENLIFEETPDVEFHYFSGPHPIGNVGTQIHHVSPINKGETIWFIHPQDVALIGRVFLKKELCFEKKVAFTGPAAENPRYLSMTYGANLSELLPIENPQIRCISGNILTGSKFDEFPSVRFYDAQITLLDEGGQREIIGWLLPGLKKWSFSHTFLAWLMKNRKFHFATSLHGGRRVFVMTDIYEKVFPFDIIPLALLKACIIKDIEQMEDLGIYEVDSEDFALCEVVCPSKTECQKIILDGLFYLKNN